MYKKMKKDGVSPVIAVILMVAITVVLAGVLYVWVTSLANTEDQAETLRLSFDDGAYDQTTDGATFSPGEAMIKCEQTGGDPINWNELTVLCEVKDSDARFELTVLTINSVAYGSANQESQTGQIVTFGVGAVDQFDNGDYVVITITKGDDKVYTSSTIRIV